MPHIKEGLAEINAREGVFYNPNMEINRDLLVSALKCLNVKDFCDGHTATGIKAIRAALEAGVENACAVDLSNNACENATSNAKMNKVKVKVIHSDIREHLMRHNHEFVEIDPFGSPAPYMHFLAESFSWRKCGYSSLTATDTAVLCGAERNACRRIYGAIPLHDEIVHEIGLRILIQRTQATLAEKNIAATPILSLSHRHYLKVFFRIERSAKKCDDALKLIAYFAYCAKCKHRKYINIGETSTCEHCGSKMMVAGPVWKGLTHDSEFVKQCANHIKNMEYKQMKEEIKLLTACIDENFDGMCYDLHSIFKGGSIPKTDNIMRRLKENGFKAEKTHYKSWIIKTDASAAQIKALS